MEKENYNPGQMAPGQKEDMHHAPLSPRHMSPCVRVLAEEGERERTLGSRDLALVQLWP